MASPTKFFAAKAGQLEIVLPARDLVDLTTPSLQLFNTSGGVIFLKSILHSVLASFFLAACAVPGAKHLETYSSAFGHADRATDEVLAVYSTLEKGARLRVTDTRTFHPDDATLYVANRLGPLSAKIDRGFDLIGIYNQLLARYATGGTLSLFDDEFSTIQDSVDSIANAAGSSEGLPGFSPLLTSVRTLTSLALARADREDFAEAVKAEKGVVDEFLAEVRSQSAVMYEAARAKTQEDIVTLKDPSKGAAALVAKREEFRVLLATWVLAIDDTRVLLADLATAVEAGGATDLNIALAAQSLERIAGYADQILIARKQIQSEF